MTISAIKVDSGPMTIIICNFVVENAHFIYTCSIFIISGLAKKKPVTPEQRQKHAEQSTLQAKWKHDADTICGITAQLRDKYGAHKGDFALGRYEQLKTMIKDAIRLFKETDESSRRHVSRRYLADAAGGKTGGGGGVGGNGSALTRLTKSAREYAAHQPASKSAEGTQRV